MKNPKYIILTPIAPFKLYCLNKFLKNIISFNPKPEELVFCAEPEIVPEISKWQQELKKREIKLVIFTLPPEILNKFPASDIGKLTYSRECLRHYFIKSKFDWALWLDCDIIPEPNVARVLLKIAKSKKFLVVSNQYRTRLSNQIIEGIGCTLVHKTACRFARFQIASLTGNEKEKRRLADDFWFFVMLSAGEDYIRELTRWNSRKVGKFVSISHINERGGIKFLEKE